MQCITYPQICCRVGLNAAVNMRLLGELLIKGIPRTPEFHRGRKQPAKALAMRRKQPPTPDSDSNSNSSDSS